MGSMTAATPAHALGEALAVDGRDAAHEQQLRGRALLLGSRLFQDGQFGAQAADLALLPADRAQVR